MEAQHKIWCDDDDHHLYEYYADFNEWLDGEEGQSLREQYGIDDLNQPSKAFYAGDKEAYEEALLASYLPEQLGDDELEALVADALAATEAVTDKDMGKVMGWLKPKVAGRADGKRLSDMVRAALEG